MFLKYTWGHSPLYHVTHRIKAITKIAPLLLSLCEFRITNNSKKDTFACIDQPLASISLHDTFFLRIVIKRKKIVQLMLMVGGLQSFGNRYARIE